MSVTMTKGIDEPRIFKFVVRLDKETVALESLTLVDYFIDVEGNQTIVKENARIFDTQAEAQAYADNYPEKAKTELIEI